MANTPKRSKAAPRTARHDADVYARSAFHSEEAVRAFRWLLRDPSQVLRAKRKTDAAIAIVAMALRASGSLTPGRQ